MEKKEMPKEILLLPDAPLSSKLEITILDFPNGVPAADEANAIPSASIDRLLDYARRRCKITAEYGRPEIQELKSKGMNLDSTLDYYQNYIYDLVKFHILSDWKPVSGLDQVMEIIKDRISPYFV